MGQIRRFAQDESGATALEYALIAVLVVLTMLVGFQVFGDALLEMYTGSDDSLSSVIENSGSGGD